MTVGLLGDAMLGRGVGEVVRHGGPNKLWDQDLLDVVWSCDLVVCNLECCISERGEPTELVPGKPFFFRAPPAALSSLERLGVRGVSLANNHALDFGDTALQDTLELLDGNGIAVTGAGEDLATARRGFVLESGPNRVGVVGFCDHPSEFRAGSPGWGVSHQDLRDRTPRWLINEIARLGSECDSVLCFPHWGPNMTTRPASWQRQRRSELLEAGANLIAGHSAHVFHGVERAGTGLCAYDLGGAIDDYAVDRRLRNDLGLLALWRPTERPELELVGLKLDYAHTGLADGRDAEWIARRLERACDELGTTATRVGTQRFAIE